MALPAGTYKLGPDDGTLSVHTGRTGAAAKAGHDLDIHVAAWEATLEVGGDSAPTSVVLEVDAGSMVVREGRGGINTLGEDDKAGIKQTIEEDVLRRGQIEFRSTQVDSGAEGDRVTVHGDLTLVGTTRPLQFELLVGADGELTGAAVIKQTEWKIKPYSTLFGALKVADEVKVAISAKLPQPA